MTRLALCVACASLLAAACSRPLPERLVLGTVENPAFGLVHIAEAKGLFAAQGLDLEHRRYPSGRDALAAMSAGAVDAATCFEMPVASSGADVAVLTLLASSRNTRVIARADRGIARAEDLAGKRIGLPRGTHAEYFLHVVLVGAGVPASAVQLADVAPDQAVDEIVAGRVDAVALWTPLAERARRLLGEGGAVDLASDAYQEMALLTTTRATIRARRPALSRLLRALAEAERLVRERPEDAFRALHAQLGEPDEEELRAAWRRIRPALGVTHELAALIEREADWLRTRGTGSVTGRGGATMEGDLLAEVDREAVTFVGAPRFVEGR